MCWLGPTSYIKSILYSGQCTDIRRQSIRRGLESKVRSSTIVIGTFYVGIYNLGLYCMFHTVVLQGPATGERGLYEIVTVYLYKNEEEKTFNRNM